MRGGNYSPGADVVIAILLFPDGSSATRKLSELLRCVTPHAWELQSA